MAQYIIDSLHAQSTDPMGQGLIDSKQAQLNTPNPYKITSGHTGYMNASKYLPNGMNYDDLPKETKIKLLEELSHKRDKIASEIQQHPHRDFDTKHVFSKKKLVLGSGRNHHEVSPEYKDLGFLHKDGRFEKYCEQDGVHDFTNMPTIFRQKRKTFAGFKTKGYDYSDRVNKNLDIHPRSNPLE